MRLYCDTNVLIQAIEGPEEALRPFMDVVDATAAKGLLLVTSKLDLSEVLVKPLKDQDAGLVEVYSNLLSGALEGGLMVVPVNRAVLVRAAEIRVRKASLKLPDAIHVATSEIAECRFLISGDRRLEGATSVALIRNEPEHFRAFVEMMT